MCLAPMPPEPQIPNVSSGARLVAVDGRTLPLRAVTVRVEAGGGIARVYLEQRFMNPYDEPLRLTYLVPMPEDAAVSGYSFLIAGRRVIGRVQPKKLAREEFERAVVEGRTAALLDEERGSLFTQALGNVPPRAEITCELIIDQPLVFLNEGAWEWRFPTVVAPRFLGAPGRTPDAARVTVDVALTSLPVNAALNLHVADALPAGGAVRSPSHAIVQVGSPTAIAFAADAALDRDVVVRWPVARPQVGVALAVGRPRGARSAYGLVTIVPPSRDQAGLPISRDLCILLDTSGSMGGAPLAQATRVASALVDSLGERDQLEMIEFGNDARRWKTGSVVATPAARAEAIAWLRGLRASGGTDMTAGIYASLDGLRADTQRQVVLITDGQIGFETEVLRQICARLPRQSRLHTVGVGSAVNRSLTRPAARAGGGIEVLIGIDEDAERAATRIVARTDRPTITEVILGGSALETSAPERPADLFAGAPALVSVQLRPEGGELWVRGRTATGPFEERIAVARTDEGAGAAICATLFARERVADRELSIAAGSEAAPLEAEIEELGMAFQIATRLTSFVAVSDERTVDPTRPTRNEVVPHAWPHGMSAGQLVAAEDAFAADSDDESLASPHSLGEIAAPASLSAFGSLRTRSAAPPSHPAPSMPSRASRPPAPKQEEEAEAAKAKKSGPSLFQRMRRALGRASRVLRGRLTLRSGGHIVVEVTLDGPLAWTRPERVTADDGRELAIVQSTADAALVASQVIRLVLTDLDVTSPVTRLTITLPAGAELVVEIES